MLSASVNMRHSLHLQHVRSVNQVHPHLQHPCRWLKYQLKEWNNKVSSICMQGLVMTCNKRRLFSSHSSCDDWWRSLILIMFYNKERTADDVDSKSCFILRYQHQLQFAPDLQQQQQCMHRRCIYLEKLLFIFSQKWCWSSWRSPQDITQKDRIRSSNLKKRIKCIWK